VRRDIFVGSNEHGGMNGETPAAPADTLTVIIPALNEAARIAAVIADLNHECAQFVTGIIVIDDGSTDDTARIAAEHRAQVIRHPANLGYGASLKTGLRNATSTHVATFDGDGQHAAADLRRLWESRRDAVMVVGARQQLIHSPLWRMPGKWLLGVVASYLVRRKIPDLNSGLRVLTRDVAARYAHLCPRGFSMSTTLTMALLSRGWPVVFVPIDVRPRHGRSTVTVVTGLETAVLLLRIICLFNPLRLFVPASIVLGLTGVAWGIPYAMAGRGISVGAMLAIVTSALLFCMGLICDQVSQLRLERHE
jgi:glycosyltransferase involved in cell wall biosynthesis